MAFFNKKKALTFSNLTHEILENGFSYIKVTDDIISLDIHKFESKIYSLNKKGSISVETFIPLVLQKAFEEIRSVHFNDFEIVPISVWTDSQSGTFYFTNYTIIKKG